MQRYLAFDLGAESGRAMLGTLSADRLALADDLDLFGQASLFQLVCRARS